MSRKLLSGLEKAEHHPYSGWGITAGGEPTPASSEPDVENSSPEEDDVCLLEHESSCGENGNSVIIDDTSSEKCLSDEHRRPSEYPSSSRYKIPKKQRKLSPISEDEHSNPNNRRSPRLRKDGVFTNTLPNRFHSSSTTNRGTSRADEIGYRILRQASAGRERQFSHHTSAASSEGYDIPTTWNSSKLECKVTLSKRWTHADPPSTNSKDEMPNSDQEQGSDLDLVSIIDSHKKSSTDRENTRSSSKCQAASKKKPKMTSNCNQEQVISEKLGHVSDGSVNEGKPAKNRRTQAAVEQNYTPDEDFDDFFSEHCVNCHSQLEMSGVCSAGHHVNNLPAQAAKPRAPLFKSTDLFYSNKAPKTLKTYSKARMTGVSPNLLRKSKSTSQCQTVPCKRKLMRKTKSELNFQASGKGKKVSDKVPQQTKKRIQAEPVVITLSDEEDQPEETKAPKEYSNGCSSFGEDSSSVENSVIPETPPSEPAPPETTPEKRLSKISQMRLQGGDLPSPKKRRRSSNCNVDHGFERDNFQAEIMLGAKALIGKLITSPTGPLEIKENQMQFEVECDKKKLHVKITGKDLVTFKVCSDPKMIFLCVTPKLALIIKNKLPEKKNFLDPGSIACAERQILLQVSQPLTEELFADLCEWVQDKLSKEFLVLDSSVAQETFDSSLAYAIQASGKAAGAGTRYNTRSCSVPKSSKPVEQLIVYPPPPTPGGIMVTTADVECLEPAEFLNDVIIDFYLKYIVQTKLLPEDRSRTHVFSSFFYNRLTQKSANADSELGKSEQMHSQVKTWTRHVNIFDKDFLVIPINERSHWFLAVICFPGLEEPVYKEKIRRSYGDSSESSSSDGRKASQDGNEDDDDDLDENTTLSGKKKSPQPRRISSRPCILTFDSLGDGCSRSKVTFNLRNYLRCEWQERMKDRDAREFSKDTMKGSAPKVPQQDNHCDCGLFVLQYVESFFEKPIHDYKIPGMNLLDWFPLEQVATKRQEIRDLIYRLKSERDESNS